MKKIVSYVLMLCVTVLVYAAQEFSFDESHSNVGFKIKHLNVSWVYGSFNKYKGSFIFDPKDSKDWKVDVTIDANSIDTRDKKRDEHLRSADFFDVKRYPVISFKGKKFSNVSEKGAKVIGDLTMHGVTKEVALEVLFNGESDDPWGNHKAGFTATTELDRKDFGIVWNKALEGSSLGKFVLGDKVAINLEIEGLLIAPRKMGKK